MIAAAMGWIGTIGSIGAYLMLTRGELHASSLRYAAVNFVSGLLCAVASAAYGAWPSVASNVVWSAIAAQSAVREVMARRALTGRAVGSWSPIAFFAVFRPSH
ncbi:MAG: hypothetical protein U0R80_05460 [Nocardioidaceae bacterium]